MYFDTHCHVNMPFFKEDHDEVIRRALSNDVSMIIVGTDYKSSKKSIDIASRYQSGVYSAIGLHPDSLIERPDKARGGTGTIPAEEFNNDIYLQLAKFHSVVAIGEIGLDYHQPELTIEELKKFKQIQKNTFNKQLLFALRLNLPVIIHCRQAHDDMLEVLNDFKKQYRTVISNDRPWGVLHCFSGNENIAWDYFNLGLMISFTGLITFSQQWDTLIRKMPEDRLLIETDAPFMTPEPYRGRRNEPVLVKYTANRIAEIRNWDLDRVAKSTTANAKKLFKLE